MAGGSGAFQGVVFWFNRVSFVSMCAAFLAPFSGGQGGCGSCGRCLLVFRLEYSHLLKEMRPCSLFCTSLSCTAVYSKKKTCSKVFVLSRALRCIRKNKHVQNFS